MFEAEMWPQRRPKPRELTVSLTKPFDSTGFQKGLPQRVIQVDRPGLGRPGYPARLRDAVTPSGAEKLWRPGLAKEVEPLADAVTDSPTHEADSGPADLDAADLDAADPDAAYPDATNLDSADSGLADPDRAQDEEARAEEAETEDSTLAQRDTRAQALAEEDQESDHSPQQAGRHIFDNDSIREIRETALAEGRAEGLAEGRAEGDAQGYARGLAEGQLKPTDDVIESLKEGYRAECLEEARLTLESEIRQELEGPIHEAGERIQKLVTELARTARDTDAFHAPLQRLALHLAEQLVRSELTSRPTAISRLIDRCLSEFGQSTLAPVTIFLNAEDRAMLSEAGLTLPAQADLRPDNTLSRGSVRVAMNGAVVEDLIETRYKALWRALTQDESAEPPASFLKNVEMVKEAFAEGPAAAADGVIDAE